jgi:hypothetical protein
MGVSGMERGDAQRQQQLLLLLLLLPDSPTQ